VKFSDRWFPELAVISEYETTRPFLRHAWLDVAGKRLAATNGHLMIVVPCEVADLDVDGFVTVEAIEFARKALRRKGVGSEIAIGCGARLECDGASFDRPTVSQIGNFPPFAEVIPTWRPGADGTVTFAVDANYIKRLANILGDGADNEDRSAMVKLTMKLPGDEPRMYSPFFVTSNDDEPGDAVGVLMPCKVNS
jgi:hypothetical protein